MTVPTDENRADYVGNGTATSYPYDFKIFNDTDLEVYIVSGGVETQLVLGTDYTVNGAGGEGGGDVVFTTAPADGDEIAIVRVIPVVQETDIRNQGRYYPEVVEDTFDRSRMIDQQLAEEVSRSLKKPVNGDQWDAKGDRITNVGDAIEDQDAYTKGQSDARFNNDVITKTGGKWDAKGLPIGSVGDADDDLEAVNRRTMESYVSSIKSGSDLTFSNVSEMQANINLYVGQHVRTLGYYEEGDGGGNDYKIVSSSSGTPDGGSFIALSGVDAIAKALFGDTIYITQFGADKTGVRLSHTALKNCLDYAGSFGASKVKAPAGRYRIGEKTVSTIDGQAFERGFTFVGEGALSTQFLIEEINSDGVVELRETSNQTSFFVGGFSFLSTLHVDDDAGKTNGTPLKIASDIDAETTGFGDRAAFGAFVRDIHIGGTGPSSGSTGARGRFTNGIVLENIWYPIVTENHVRNVGSDVADKGIKYLDCYDPRSWKNYVRGSWPYGIWHNTIKTSGPSYEGGYVSDCTIVGPIVCIGIFHNTHPNLYEPGFHITDNHLNPKNFGARISSHRQIIIANNYGYVPNENETTSVLPAIFYLEQASDVTLSGNQYLEAGFYNNDDNASCGVRVGAQSNGIFVDGETFNHGGVGIYSESNTGNNRGVLVGTNYCRAGQATSAWAQFKYIVDKTGNVSEEGRSEGRNAFRFSDNSNTNVVGGMQLIRKRTDFATSTTGVLSGLSVRGLNSVGTEMLVTQLRTDWLDNTDGLETAIMECFQVRNGVNATAFRVEGSGKFNAPEGYQSGGSVGASGTFTASSGETITVTGGIITSIS